MSAAPAAGARALRAFLDETRAWVDGALERRLLGDGVPASLAEALRYAALGPGKRLRPALVRLVARSFGGDDAVAERPAVAVEMIHTYSLVHDDLPCMDDDDLRRGRPTSHVVHGEALAVLVGDALQTRAFEVLAGAESGAELCACLARAAGAGGMVGGQVLDIESEAGGSLDAAQVEAIHATKTAALFEASSELGAIAAGAASDERASARAFGRALGLAFQATDDVLDVTGDAATLGKTPGKDAALERGTLVAALGLEGAREAVARRTAEALEAAQRLPAGPDGLLVELVREIERRRS